MTRDTDEIRVLWLTPDKPANISVGRQQIATRLADQGMDVTVRGTTTRTVRQSVQDSPGYDVLIGTTRAGAIAATLVGALRGTPFVVDHIDPIRQLYETHPRWLASVVERLENLAFRRAAHVLYVYDEEANRINHQTSDYSQTNLGVNYDRFADPDPAAIQTAATTLETRDLHDNIAIYVGGLEEIYNIRAMLAAMEMLPDWTLLVVGTGSLEPQVEAAADANENIEYLGVVPHDTVPGYLHHADVGVSLVDDPHTLKILEYLATDTPAVQLDGRARARFGDHVTYCSRDPGEIATAIEAAAGDRVTEDTHDFVRQVSWSTIADQYAAVLRDVTAETT